MTTVAACRRCGAEPLENAQFCHSCGSRLDSGDTHPEYKQVTILFADVVHSMDIAATVGAERLREIEDALVIAERAGNDMAPAFARMALGVALAHRHTAAERDRGLTLLAEVSDVFARDAHNLGDRPLVDVYVAREMARRDARDEGIQLMRASTECLVREGQMLAWGVAATGVLAQTLLDRGADGDVAEAETAIERLAVVPADERLVIRDIWLLRLQALLARAHGDAAAYAELRDRYRETAKTLGFEGHIAWAEAMR